jgi:Fanconi anemia group M protein
MEEALKIIADIREKNSLVIASLKELGIEVEIKHLILADYIISNEIAVERKTINDFISSMINKRLPQQLNDLKRNYKIPLLLIEKEDHQELCKPSLHSNIHENAVRGMILSILTGFNVPIIFTEGYEDTAKYLMLLAKHQEKGKQEISLVAKRKAFSIKDQQQIILESFPGIGPSLAKEMLKHFKSIRNIVNASLEELEKIPKLGKKKAMIIKRLLEISY